MSAITPAMVGQLRAMTGAGLMDAVLQGADLRGTNLQQANLFGADLSRVRADAGTRLADCNIERMRVHPRRAQQALS